MTVAAEPVPAAHSEPVQSDSTSDSAAAVDLTDEEQKSIGVETTEVKRQTIRKEIVAPAKSPSRKPASDRSVRGSAAASTSYYSMSPAKM